MLTLHGGWSHRLAIDTKPPRSVVPHIPMMPHASASSQDHHQLLPYISRILMEEGEEEEDMDPQHPALLHAQQPFAQILSCSGLLASAFMPDQGTVLCKDNGALNTCSSDALKLKDTDTVSSKEYSADMFSTAFMKGMEEANKLLPAYNYLTTCAQDPLIKKINGSRKVRHDEDDNICRRSKLVMDELVEEDAHQTFEQMMMRSGHDICFKEGMGVQCVAMEKAGKNNRKGRKSKAEGRSGMVEAVDLHTLLVHCAKAVMDDRRSAAELLKEIKQHASCQGDATQRLAYYFAEGLDARLAGMGSQVYRSVLARRTSATVFLKAYQFFMNTCCFRQVAFTFANKAIFNAAAGRSKLHIVDYGLHHGFQWPELLRWLGDRDGGPPEVRITHIDLPQPGFRPANHMEEMGNRLTNCAREFGVPFKYRAIAEQWHTVCIDDLNMELDEALAINDLYNFRTLMDESIVRDDLCPRDSVLNNISKMHPDVFVQGAVNGLYGTFFMSRFREALFFHSALFDMLDATMPRDCQLRLVLEQDVLAWAALNAIACEGKDRVERGETYKQWQVRNQRAGLRQLPLDREIVKVVRDMVKNRYHKDFVIEEDQQWLLQGWKGRILFAHSTWVEDSANSDC